MKIHTATFAGLLILLAAVATAGERDLRALPGYVDLEAIGLPDGLEATVEINLPTAMLKFLAGAASTAEGADPEVASVFAGLEHVRILVVPLAPGAASHVRSKVDQLIGRLERDAWSPVVRVKEVGETVNIFTRMVGDKLAGFALVVTDAEELVFINIVGEMDPARMGALIGMMPVGDELGLDALEGLGAGAGAGGR